MPRFGERAKNCLWSGPSGFKHKFSFALVFKCLYEGGSKSSRKSAAKFVIVMRNLRSLCML